MKAVVILGAGATKACGGPLTNEILPAAFKCRKEYPDINREGFLDLLGDFLSNNFNVRRPGSRTRADLYPGLPLLLSLIDKAIDRKHPLGPNWRPQQLTEVRDALEHTIFALLEYKLRTTIGHHPHIDLFRMLYRDSKSEPEVISLNYDIIVDNAMLRFSESRNNRQARFPDYGCDIKTKFYADQPNYFGKLLKLHGSLNWIYCPGCHRLDLGISKSGRRTAKVLENLYIENPLEPRYACHGSPCKDCETFVRPVLITPTHMKDYRNPHIAQVWYQAERVLREADRAIFVGYSLPEDDVDVIYLLKRSLAKIDPKRITVVEYDKKKRSLRRHPVGSRYRSLFGDDLDWRTEGFEEWIKGHHRLKLSPLKDRLPKP